MEVQKWFERWYVKQFKVGRFLLEKNPSGEYIDDIINSMYIGFVAAWRIKSHDQG